MSQSHVCHNSVYVTVQCMSHPIVCHSPVYVTSHRMSHSSVSQSNICYNPLYVTVQCMSQSSVCHIPVYVRVQCMSQSSVCHSPIYVTIRCRSQSSVSHSPNSPVYVTGQYVTIRCRSQSSVSHSPMYVTVQCVSQSNVHSLTIMLWDWGYRIKLEQKTWVLSVFYSKYIPSASIQQVARSNKDWKDLCTSSCGMARRLDVTAAWMSWTSSNRRPFNGNQFEEQNIITGG